MIQAVKIIGTNLATTGLIGAVIDIGMVLGGPPTGIEAINSFELLYR